MRRRLAAAVVLAAFAAVGVAAQDYFQWRRGFRREPPRLPTADELEALRADPNVAAFLDGAPRD